MQNRNFQSQIISSEIFSCAYIDSYILHSTYINTSSYADFCNEKKKIMRKDNGTPNRQTFNQKRTGGEIKKGP